MSGDQGCPLFMQKHRPTLDIPFSPLYNDHTGTAPTPMWQGLAYVPHAVLKRVSACNGLQQVPRKRSVSTNFADPIWQQMVNEWHKPTPLGKEY